MRRWTLRIILLSVVAVVLILVYLKNCTRIDIPFFGRISEGIIQFKSEPTNPNDPMASFLSDEMTVKFKDGRSSAQLKALGMQSSFISDNRTQSFYSVVSLVGARYASVMTMAEIKKVNYYFPDYDVDETDEIKKIAGYKCHKAILNFKNGARRPITVWYTREINIDNPNWANAYYKIDGVLMDYQLEKFGMSLHFTATAVQKQSLPESEFVIPKDYKRVPNGQLEEMFAAFH